MIEIEDKKVINEEYKFPPIDILDNLEKVEISEEELGRKAAILQKGLSSFKIKANVKDVSVGPVLTVYELKLEPGVSIKDIRKEKNEFEYLLGEEIVKIYPIASNGTVGIATKNEHMERVLFKDIVSSSEFQDNSSNLLIGVGKDLSGKIITIDLKRTSHMLISGMTGSGKSVFLNSLICSVLYKANPDDVKLVLIDTKQGVEASFYNGVPHLFCPIITEESRACYILKVLSGYLDVLYNDLTKLDCKNIDEYNKKSSKTKMFNTLIVIDKFEELCESFYYDEIRACIDKIAMYGEKVGMYLIIATSKPQVSIVSGTSKNNIKTRIAFKSTSLVDSRLIIDCGDAKDLFGEGDMLIKKQGEEKITRCKGVCLSDGEINRIVENIKNNNSDLVGKYVLKESPNDIVESNKQSIEGSYSDSDHINDPLIDEAMKVVIETGQASTSFIQRYFKVGYARAGRIIDQLEERGIISGYQGSKPREVLIDKTQWDIIKDNRNRLADTEQKRRRRK